MTTWTRPVRGATDHWLTPPELLALLGPFDLDPCAAPEPRPWATASEMWSELGLDREWRGFVWLNPPFGPETRRWIERLARHGNGIALTFARTDTAWFQRWVFGEADGLLFLAGRPTFCRLDGTPGPGNSGGAIVLAAYGSEAMGRLRAADLDGVIVDLRGAA